MAAEIPQNPCSGKLKSLESFKKIIYKDFLSFWLRVCSLSAKSRWWAQDGHWYGKKTDMELSIANLHA